jgi:PAS domain S-box-containing protein
MTEPKTEKVKCWEVLGCNEKDCPAYKAQELKCWLVPGTLCRNEIQGKFLEKIELCLDCEPFKKNVDLDSMEETLKVVNDQFTAFREMVQDRDRELEDLSMELALGLSEVFEALKQISSGNPAARVSEESRLELISKLKHIVNTTAENLGEIVNLSHDFAIGLAEHFDVLHRVSKGNLSARVSGFSQVELLQSLGKVTNEMIESVSTEIAERRQAERALRESEEKYSTLVENSLIGIYIDEEGKIAFANNRFGDIFGYSRHELEGMDVLDFVHPEDKQLVKETRQRRLQGEHVPSEYEARGIKKSGETIWIKRRNSRIEYHGKPAILGNIVDISARKYAEAELQKARDELEQRVKERTAELMVANQKLQQEVEDRLRIEEEVKASEDKYRLLFNNDPNPLFTVDWDSGKILDVNNSAGVTYQYEHAELLGMSFLDLLDPDEARRVWAELEHAPQDVYVFVPKVWAKKKNGDNFVINLHARSGKLRDAENGTTGGALIVRTVDVTRRLEQDAKLTQASKMATLGEMATGIAHEINQPLNAIQVGTDFLAKMIKKGREIPPEQLLKVSRNISDQVARCSNIINHLREFGRKSDFHVYPVDLNEPIRDVFTMLGQQLNLRNIDVKLDLAETLPPIQGDKNRLEQIFLNLVTNARDAMETLPTEKPRRLTISTRQEDNTVEAVVADTGEGISEQTQKKIFEPFFTTKQVGRGTGLGLSISYSLVKDFKGDIEVESTLGEGTTFTLTFPIAPKQGAQSDETPHH